MAASNQELRRRAQKLMRMSESIGALPSYELARSGLARAGADVARRQQAKFWNALAKSVCEFAVDEYESTSWMTVSDKLCDEIYFQAMARLGLGLEAHEVPELAALLDMLDSVEDEAFVGFGEDPRAIEGLYDVTYGELHQANDSGSSGSDFAPHEMVIQERSKPQMYRWRESANASFTTSRRTHRPVGRPARLGSTDGAEVASMLIEACPSLTIDEMKAAFGRGRKAAKAKLDFNTVSVIVRKLLSEGSARPEGVAAALECGVRTIDRVNAIHHAA